MVLGPMEFARLQNFVSSDVYNDLQHARARNRLLDNELYEIKRQVEGDETDDTYKTLLLCLLAKVETGEGCKKRKEKEAVNEHNDDSTEEENDPEYELFLKHLKEHNKYYVLEYEKDSSHVVIKYNGDTDSDEDSDQEPRRVTRGIKQKNQMLGVENLTKHDQESNLVKKSKERTRSQLRNEAGHVVSAKDFSNNVVPDPEDLHIQHKVELAHDHNIYKGSSRTLLNRMPIMKSRQKRDLQPTSVKKIKHQNRKKSKNEAAKVDIVKRSLNNMVPDPEYLRLHQNVEKEDENLHEGNTLLIERLYGVNYLKKQDDKKLKGTMKQKIRSSNQMPAAENQHKHGLQFDSVKKTLAQRKLRNVAYKVENKKASPNDMVQDSGYLLHKNVKIEDNNYVHMHKGDTAKNEKIDGVKDEKRPDQRKLTRDMEQNVGPSNQMPVANNQRKHEAQTTSAKKTRRLTLQNPRNWNEKVDITSAKKTRRLSLGKSGNWIEKVDTVKYLPSKFRDAKDSKCLMANKNIAGNNLEEGQDDVEILDSAAFLQEGISSPFVASKKFSRSGGKGIQRLGRSSAYDEFRRQMLDVLRKPYDKEEYADHQARIRTGSYLDYHPDVGKKLKKHRYNRRKRLAILRGFFFWLQHLTREGAFKPWKDGECLAVEPEDLHGTSSREFWYMSGSLK
ncbi:UNVERIFIED_CONTAM: hypothetical protein Slati_2297400 [Sesamum latifolium]|uniref:Uncharacterized protein n=1 Tax=Sesamum latifolium TaxID=2727402 RepID=A0AAW2W8H7_9LAMI